MPMMKSDLAKALAKIAELEAENKNLREGIAAIKTVAESPFKDHWCIRMCEELLKEGGSE